MIAWLYNYNSIIVLNSDCSEIVEIVVEIVFLKQQLSDSYKVQHTDLKNKNECHSDAFYA